MDKQVATHKCYTLYIASTKCTKMLDTATLLLVLILPLSTLYLSVSLCYLRQTLTVTKNVPVLFLRRFKYIQLPNVMISNVQNKLPNPKQTF